MVSIILINWNGKQFLPACLDAIAGQSYRDYEVVIIDNNSTDASQDLLRQRQTPPAARLLLNAQNLGYCGGANQGVRETRGEYVLLLNPDVMLHEEYLARLIGGMQGDPTIGTATGKVLRFDRHTIDSTGQFLRKDLTPLERGYGEPDTGQYEHAEYVFSACGAVVLYRRAMLEAIQLAGEYFDETYSSYYEDLDVGWRAQIFGWKAYYVPEAIAYHYRGGGLAGVQPRQQWFERLPFLPKVSFTQKPASIQRHIIKNRYMTLLKNATWRDVYHGLPAILKFEALMWGYILCVRPSLSTAIIDVLRRLPTTVQKRQHIQSQRHRRQGD